jgi:hypothetical protein
MTIEVLVFEEALDGLGLPPCREAALILAMDLGTAPRRLGRSLFTVLFSTKDLTT